jgi:hypothetical protein
MKIRKIYSECPTLLALGKVLVTSFTVVGGGIFPHEVYFSGHDHFNGR